MRQDLAKCTTERPRHGRSWAITKKCGGSVRVNPYRDFDYPEEYGGFRSSSRNRQINAKDFSDFLSPLRGAIRKNIGRPWGKVFGEFCEALDRRGLSGYHIWTHLMWEVETNTFLGEDGQVYERPAFGGSPSKVDGFYVHPLTGLLLYKEPWRFRRLELSIALARMAGITPAMVVCEMLDDNNGKALSKEKAKEYGKDNGLIFLEGQEIIEAYVTWTCS